jgi:hypothetical protein
VSELEFKTLIKIINPDYCLILSLFKLGDKFTMKSKTLFATTLTVSIMTIAFLFVATFGATQTFAQGITVYNSIPQPLPGNLPSYGVEAYAFTEIGDQIQFSSGSGRNLVTGMVTMSSWGCESGNWHTNDCVTTPGSTFSHPITLNIYEASAGATPGALLGTFTQTFKIPYRPSADLVNCTGGRWYDAASATCFNGLATNITFNLGGLLVPNEVVYGIAYNTSHYGDTPVGVAACYSESGGCGYDSLNVAIHNVVTVGTNSDPNDAFWSRLRDYGWDGYQPAVKFNAANNATNANQCKNGGWQTRTRADGSTFKNQGDCVSYTKNGK